jgi:hypothetical protein
MNDQNRELEAQGMLIKGNPVMPISLGDTVVEWYADMGNPTTESDATLDGDAYYDDYDIGVVLTQAVDGQTGTLSWDRVYDYTRDIHITSTIAAGGGDGADGIIFFFGASGAVVSPGIGNGGVSVFFDEYNGNNIKVYQDTNLIRTYPSTQDLDNTEFRKVDLIYQYETETLQTLTVLLNGVHICKVNLDEWASAGECIGVSAFTGGSNNIHMVRTFSVKSAQPWLAVN